MAFDLKAIKQIGPYLYEIEPGYRQDMKVPARFYADAEILEAAAKDRSIEQLLNVASLPGMVSYVLAMPDMHEGYGFPIGGVAAADMRDGLISPGGVGYDINCGVRLLGTGMDAEAVRPHLPRLLDAIVASVPAGLGEGGGIKLSKSRIDDVLEGGVSWAVSEGYGEAADVDHCEENGCLRVARADTVSVRAKERGHDQLGTLGSGNHFLELAEVMEVFDSEAADAFRLRPGQLVVQVHSGSRGLGHQVCTDYVHDFQPLAKRMNLTLPDRELVCAALNSQEGQEYLAAMSAAANYAWANRQVMTAFLRRAFEAALAGKLRNPHLFLIYDVAHNVAKLEQHFVRGRNVKVCVHRKGATRAFPAGHEAVPQAYAKFGQPVLVPGDMGTASFVLRGTEQAMRESFGSCCHGAGRAMSRSAARKQINAQELRRRLEEQGVSVRAHSAAGLAEEAPDAYKDVYRVVEAAVGAGLATKVARLKPIAVVKG